MSYVGSYSTVLFATFPFNIPVNANVADSLVSQVDIFSPRPVSQGSLNLAYTFTPPAIALNLFSYENASVLLAMQEY